MANSKDRAVAGSSQRKERDAMTHNRRAARTNERRAQDGGRRMGRFLVILPILVLLAGGTAPARAETIFTIWGFLITCWRLIGIGLSKHCETTRSISSSRNFPGKIIALA